MAGGDLARPSRRRWNGVVAGVAHPVRAELLVLHEGPAGSAGANKLPRAASDRGHAHAWPERGQWQTRYASHDTRGAARCSYRGPVHATTGIVRSFADRAWGRGHRSVDWSWWSHEG